MHSGSSRAACRRACASSTRRASSRAPGAAGSGTPTAASTSTSTPGSARSSSVTPTTASAKSRMETAAEIDVVGAGSSELEIELAEKIQRARPVGRAGAVLEQRLGGDVPRDPRGAGRDRPAAGREVPGLLSRLARLHRGERHQPPRPGRARIDPISAGILPQALEWLVVLPFNDVEALDDLMRERGHEIAAVILEPVIHTIGCVVPTDEFMPALRRTTDRGRLDPDLRRGRDRVPPRPRRLPGDLRHHAGPDDVRQGDRQRLPARGAVRPGRPDGALQHAARAGRSCSAAPTTATRCRWPPRWPRSRSSRPTTGPSTGACSASATTIQTRARGHRRTGSAWPRRRRASARSSCCYFTDGEVRSFDDALTSDAELYVAFHRGMTERGFLMLPLNLKRNHLTAAHSDEDVARMLQAAEDVLGGLARPRHPARAVRLARGRRPGGAAVTDHADTRRPPAHGAARRGRRLRPGPRRRGRGDRRSRSWAVAASTSSCPRTPPRPTRRSGPRMR